MIWRKYSDLEPIRRLPEDGRELLGRQIFYTEKRDGENVSIWLDWSDSVETPTGPERIFTVHISSREP